ncbi:MAG: MFS transporter [Candidatus Eremiobacteraeota bacterium]|nr:MFS transporter [Candidatus Eremiobacteraeota bacterium]
MRQLFASREFVAYFIARQSSLLGYSIEATAIGWQIYGLRHHPLDIGLVGLILFIPQVVFALPAGIIADRVDRRAVCLSISLIEMAALLFFATLALLESRSLILYFSAVALIGIAHAVGTPAERSMLAGIVEGGQFVRASAMSSSIGQFIYIVGPALAGALIAIGTPIAFGAAAIGYAGAAVGFTLLPRRAVPYEEEPLLQAALQGVGFIMARKIILGSITLDLFAVLFGGAVALLPVYAANILHVGPTGFGLLRSAPAFGAAMVAIAIARRSIARRAGRLLLWCVTGFGVFTIVFGVSKNMALSLVALMLIGGFDMVSVAIRNAIVQLGTPEAMRGRVSAVENIFIGGSNELGAFESGGLAALIGAEASVVVGGVATLVVVALSASIFPALRTLDHLLPQEDRA